MQRWVNMYSFYVCLLGKEMIVYGSLSMVCACMVLLLFVDDYNYTGIDLLELALRLPLLSSRFTSPIVFSATLDVPMRGVHLTWLSLGN